jgi:diphosphate--fructose-6-phosphate 1-phosphotransferase
MAELCGSVVIDRENYSELQLERLLYKPALPDCLANAAAISVVPGELTAAPSASDERTLHSWLPHIVGKPLVSLSSSTAPAAVSAGRTRTVGVVFCGRQCPGGNNIVSGLYDFCTASPDTRVIGFVGGTQGLFDGKYITITPELLASFRNQGGYHMLGRSVDKIRTATGQAAALATCTSLKLDGLVLVGGTFTNTDAAHLAEYFAAHQQPGSRTAVIGVPATIDGDVHSQFVEQTLGFDTATRVYSQLVGNMATDGNSAKKVSTAHHALHVVSESVALDRPPFQYSTVLVFHPPHGPPRLANRARGRAADSPQRRPPRRRDRSGEWGSFVTPTPSLYNYPLPHSSSPCACSAS